MQPGYNIFIGQINVGILVEKSNSINWEISGLGILKLKGISRSGT
jgi:hypothetical protein